MRRYTVMFKALADETRLRLLRLILEAGHPVCVCELADALGLPLYHVSKHLAILRQAGLVVDDRRGTWVDYAPSRESPLLVDICEMVRRRITGPRFERDLQRLRVRLGLRQEGQCVLGPGHPLANSALAHAGLTDSTPADSDKEERS
ncbi:MAG: helix-turn-helix transcriptional regulator [Firmicutes bacterium]|nr:helix-turn-helix transcriptional regulator [Bacillota bacterium]